MTLKFNRVLEFAVQNIINLSAAVMSANKRFTLSRATVKNPKIRSCDLDL